SESLITWKAARVRFSRSWKRFLKANRERKQSCPRRRELSVAAGMGLVFDAFTNGRTLALLSRSARYTQFRAVEHWCVSDAFPPPSLDLLFVASDRSVGSEAKCRTLPDRKHEFRRPSFCRQCIFIPRATHFQRRACRGSLCRDDLR